MTNVAVFGARGYLGRETAAILADHPSVETVLPVSSTVAGQTIADAVPSLRHLDTTFLGPQDETLAEAEVALLATGSIQAQRSLDHLEALGPPELIVDLSRAHRQAALAGSGPWVYGLPEVPGHVDEATTRVANPGCYPTAALLALAPALQAEAIGPGAIVVDGKSGVSGAGATPREDLHFPEANESTRAYSVEDHDHQAEIQAAAAQLHPRASGPGSANAVRFTPHLVPQSRGLLVTAYAPLAPDAEPEALAAIYGKAYADTPGVVLGHEPDTAHVRGSNRAELAVTVDEDADLLVARCAIDNIVKGGAGTAVHNMNLALGFDEHAGIPWAGVSP